MILKTRTQSAIAQYAVIPFYFTAKKHGVITLFTIASIAAVEKRPLSYQPTTICVQGSKLWCSDLAIDNALRG